MEEAELEPQGREREGGGDRKREIILQMRLFSHTDPTHRPSGCISVSKPLRFGFLSLFPHSLVAMLKRVFSDFTYTPRSFTDSAVRSVQLCL